jgi:prepilin-type N-terminal cleavage/methylation domain-containing protein
MKNNQTTPTVESPESRVQGRHKVASHFFRPRPSTFDPRHAFTLIELLLVISIIAIIAAFTVPVISFIKRLAYVNKTKAEMAQIETAIERYKAAYGFYPPSNPNSLLINQLYYELVGTVNTNTVQYTTLDGRSQIPAVNAFNYFSVNGFLNFSANTNKINEDAPVAKTFLPDLKATQIGAYTNPPINIRSIGVDLLIGSVGGPYQKYAPISGVPGMNPWRYNSSSPTNNPGSYDLYIQLVIKPGQTNLICNWTKQVQINSPLR